MKITVDPNWTPGMFRLIAHSHGFAEPAGPRLFKSPPHPEVEFVHADLSTANEHAIRLQKYLDGQQVKKKKSTSKSAHEE